MGTGTLSAGLATLSTSALSVASHPITAVYGGDSNFKGSDNSSSPLTQTVNPANSTTAVSSSAYPAVFGQSVTFTATVSAVAPATGTPTGTVTFKDGGTTIGTGALSAGQATADELFAAAAPHFGGKKQLTLALDRDLVVSLDCACGDKRSVLKPQQLVGADDAKCPKCGLCVFP